MVYLSITGLVRTILIIIAVIVIIRLVNQLLNARKNIAEEKRLHQDKSNEEREKKEYEKNKGKVSISIGNESAEDVDFEEVDDKKG